MGQQYPQPALGLYLNFNFGVGFEFSPNTDPAGPVPKGPFSNTHMVPSQNYAWLSRGVPLLRAPDTSLLCPITSWGKTNFPWNLSPVGRRGQQYPQLALGPVPELWLRSRLPGLRLATLRPPSSSIPGFSIKQIFPEYWLPRGKMTTLPTFPTRSRTWPLTSG